MESLSEHEAMRVLQAAAALDAITRVNGTRNGAIAPSWPPPASTQQQQQQPQTGFPDLPSSASQGLGEDGYGDLAETESGQQKRQGDLDSWLDVFRATATSVRNAWRQTEAPLSFESLAFGWLALARKHEPLPCVPPAAAGEEVTDASSLPPGWLSEAQWALAAYMTSCPGGGGGGAAASGEEQLRSLLGLQPEDLLVYRPTPSGWRPAFFIAVHHPSRTVRVVVRGSSSLRDLLTSLAGHCSPLPAGVMGGGYAHHGILSAAT
ncbi:hypothetical protein Agub_g12694, partial [Astrephomene gubernaculifera]